MRSIYFFLSASILGMCIFTGFGLANSSPEETKKRTIRWAVAHEPDNKDLLRVLEKFGRRIKEESGGELELLLKFDGEKKIRGNDALSMVIRGEAEMSQLTTSNLSQVSDEFNALDAPFLFRNYAHAESFMDGEVGSRLLEGLLKGSNGKLRGVAYTYSGGFRQIYGSRSIGSIEEFSSARIFEPFSRFGWEMLDHLEMKFVGPKEPPRKNSLEFFRSGTVDFEEGVYVRLGKMLNDKNFKASKINFVNETNHSLLMTAIVVNENFLRSLKKHHGELLLSAAQKVAQDERVVSLQLETESRAAAIRSGLKVVKMPKKEHERLIKVSEKIYQKYENRFGELFEQIRRIEEKPSQTIGTL